MRKCSVAVVMGFLVIAGCKRVPAVAPVKTQATPPTMPATTKGAIATSRPVTPKTFIELVKRSYPNLSATQPLDTPLDRKDAARILLRDPIYLDHSQHLWITRPDADPTETVLLRAGTETDHLIRERPAYVHWRYEPPGRRQPGRSTPVLVCPVAGGNQFEMIEERRRTLMTGLRGGYRWSDAFSWGDNFVVGNSTGASVFERTPTGWIEHPSPELIDAKIPHGPTRVAVELAGLLAYVPADGEHRGSKGTARFVDGKWSLLEDRTRWPGNFLHLIPLADSSVLQIIVTDDGDARLAITDFNTTQIDPRQVIQLLEQLNSPSIELRTAAFHQLSTYGTGLWPILETQMKNQPTSVQEKMAELLKNKTDPTLGEMTLVDTQLKLVARDPDGGVLLFSKGGVSVKNVDLDETLAAPAWINVRPGQPIRLMLGQAWEDLTPSRNRFYAIGDGDWIVSDEENGPREFIGTFDLSPILRKSEVKYSEFVGIDRHGRWFFRERVGTDGGEPLETLILDPTLPPVSPRLPVWEFRADGGTVGCDDQDWPAYKDRAGNVWIIGENGFQLLDEKKNHFIDNPADLAKRPSRSPATTRVATPALIRPDPLLLTLTDGTRFYGGKTSLRRVAASGAIDWPLPPEAQGSFSPWLVTDSDGHLFLFNEPGRLLRIRSIPGAAEPFTIEAAFAHKIPKVEPSRVWVDLAGRIIIAHDGNQMAICFPAGVVPLAIAEKMPVGEQDQGD